MRGDRDAVFVDRAEHRVAFALEPVARLGMFVALLG